jgi:non-specific serine/threonine protein kinase
VEQALTINREAGHRDYEANNLIELGVIAGEQGDFAVAQTYYREGLRIKTEMKVRDRGVAQTLCSLAQVAAEQGHMERAARLLGIQAALREATSTPVEPMEQPMMDAQVTTARDALGAEAFAVAWEAGHSMAWEAAVAYALGEEGS